MRWSQLFIPTLREAPAEAESASHQLPINPNVKAKLPPGMLTPADVKVMEVDWAKAADQWADSQRLMAELFGK